MSVPVMQFQWTGDSFQPASPHWVHEADKHLVVGKVYPLEVREDRSSASHRGYFAAINEAHQNLSDQDRERWPSPDHLRRYALIKCGYADERSVVCPTETVAVRMAAFIRPMDGYAIVAPEGCVVRVWTAKSQSMRAMDKKTFQASKDAVLAYIASLIGTTAGELQRGGSAANNSAPDAVECYRA